MENRLKEGDETLHVEEMRMNWERKIRKQVIHELNGHFLFNALCVIMVVTRTNPEQARVLEKEFGDYLRGSMRAAQMSEWVSLKGELKMVRAYFHIQSVRSAGRLSYEVHTEAEELLVPAGLLRIFAENAMHHGGGNRKKGSRVMVTQKLVPGGQRIRISDNGKGFIPEEIEKRKSGGVFRARRICGQIEGAELKIKSAPERGTVVELFLPVRSQEMRPK